MDQNNNCIFCRILDGSMPAAWVIDSGPIVAIMDAFPLRPGHVLIMPREHQPLVTHLDEKTRSNLMETGTRIARAMRELHPPGTDINWLINDGKAAWQHVPHVHLHLIPRSGRDNLNFISRIATRFLKKPDMEKLEADAAQLRTTLKRD